MEFGLGLIDVFLIPLIFIGLPLAAVFLIFAVYRSIFRPMRSSSLEDRPQHLTPVDAGTQAKLEELEQQLARAEERADFADALLHHRSEKKQADPQA